MPWEIYIHMVFLPLNIILFLRDSRSIRLELKLLGLFFLVTYPFEWYASFVQVQGGDNNLFVYHLLVPIQYLVFALIYYFAIASAAVKKIILCSIPCYSVISAWLTLTVEPFEIYNSFAIMLENALLALWVLVYYKELFLRRTPVVLKREPIFWISTGLLFFSVGDFFAEGLMSTVIGLDPQLAKLLFYAIYVPLLFFFYLMCTTAFVCRELFKSSVRLQVAEGNVY